jgi:Protease inhibitor Inh
MAPRTKNHKVRGMRLDLRAVTAQCCCTRLFRVLVLMVAYCASGPALLRAEAPAEDLSNRMVGSWELSNAERDKTCAINFRLEAAGAGRALDLSKACSELFPETRDITAWAIGRDEALRLLDAKAKPVLEFIEVENGLFEPLHPGPSLYFLQTVAAVQGRDRTADQMFGDWAFVRGSGKQICQMSLHDVAADPESFALSLKPGCDLLVTNFGPRGWKIDRGLLTLLSSRGDPWRFEERDPGSWHRIPEGRQPLLLLKQ